MIPVEIIGLAPAPEGTAPAQAGEALGLLLDRLRTSGREARDVLSLTFFVDATDPASYRRRKEQVHSVVPEVFDSDPAPVSIVAQPPEGSRHAALEATILAAPAGGVEVSRRTCDGVLYTVAAGRGARQVHTGGICSVDGTDGTAAQAKEAFARMEAILDRERMTFGHVVRQWNYVEGVLGDGAAGGPGRLGYQAFNDVRTLSYDRSEFPTGYPAATGIGQAAGGVVLAFIALDAPADVRVVPLSNPKQVDAHRYSEDVLVGEPLEGLSAGTPPKFERAKMVCGGDQEIVFVSGTAAILGEESVAPGDVVAQTKTTIEIIGTLVPGGRLSYLRAYVKRSEDIPAVREVCEAEYGPIPALYVRADVCRDELLVELEGVVGPIGIGEAR